MKINVKIILVVAVAYEPNTGVLTIPYIKSRREKTVFVCYEFFNQVRTRFGRSQSISDGMHCGRHPYAFRVCPIIFPIRALTLGTL